MSEDLLRGLIILGGAILWTAWLGIMGSQMVKATQSGQDYLTILLLVAGLTGIALFGFMFIQQTDMLTLAATGMGALASSVTAYGRGRTPPPPAPKEKSDGSGEDQRPDRLG
jgi:hypothetical protein